MSSRLLEPLWCQLCEKDCEWCPAKPQESAEKLLVAPGRQ